jgi:hypothetical protein
MEKESSQQGGKVREERTDDINGYPRPATDTSKRDESKETDSTVRLKRIRAYQRIDYWQ